MRKNNTLQERGMSSNDSVRSLASSDSGPAALAITNAPSAPNSLSPVRGSENARLFKYGRTSNNVASFGGGGRGFGSSRIT